MPSGLLVMGEVNYLKTHRLDVYDISLQRMKELRANSTSPSESPKEKEERIRKEKEEEIEKLKKEMAELGFIV